MARRRLQRKGHLYKDGNWWRLRWREDSRDADGSIVRSRPSAVIGPCKGPGAMTRKEADRIAWEMILSKLDTFTACPRSLMTLNQFIAQKFEPEIVSTLKPSGQKHYRYCLGKIVEMIGDLPLRDVNASAVYSLIQKHRAKYSTQTLRHLRNAISAVFAHAKRVGHYTGDNPASLVQLPRMVREERTALTWQQAAAALSLLPTPVRESVFLSMTTSLNVAELCGLRWKRLNLTGEDIVVTGEVIPPLSLAVRENYYENEYCSTKSGNRSRIVPIPSDVISMLTALKRESKFTGPDDPVFASRNGTPIDAHNVSNRIFAKVSKAIGAKVTWHVLRHTCATMAEQVGMSKSDRIALLGHGDGAMTDHYTHSDITRRRAGVDQIGRKILESGAQGATLQ